MMRKKINGRKQDGATGVVEDSAEVNPVAEAADNATPEAAAAPSKPKRKANVDQESNGNVGIGEIRKAAAFANSVGGLDKAIALLQILKVAKEVQ